MSNRRRLVVAAAALGAAAVFLLWRTGEDRQPGADPAAPSPAPAAAPSTDRPSGGPGAEQPPPRPALAAGGITVERLERARDDYLAVAVYPTWSRPLDEGSQYKLRWNEPVVSELPFGEEGNLRYRFAADRAHVIADQSLSSWIEVWRGDDRRDRVPVVVHDAWVTDGERRFLALLYEPGPDGEPRNTFAPADYDELDGPGRQLRILAEIEVEGERRTVVRDFTYAPRRLLTIRGVSDRVEDGNLVVRLDLEVHEAGLYQFEANALSAADDSPLAYASLGQTLEAGRQSVDLPFFGKIFHDQQGPGPYLIRDFRGYLIPPGDDDYYVWWSDPRTHLTAAYRLDQLSPEVWDAPEKREKLQHFDELISQTARGQIGQPIGP
jgi:hypothetical protein